MNELTYIPLTAIDCLTPALLIDRNAPLDVLQANATVTICHSKTKNLPDILRQADIIVAAIGKANFVTEDMVKEGVVLVDVGINAVAGKIVGDLTHGAHVKASAYTPVPGGVGVVSNVMVMKALVR